MGKNLVSLISIRLDRDLKEWLLNHSQKKEEAVNSVVKKALREYRAKIEKQEQNNV